MAFTLRHREGAHGIAPEVPALDQPAPEAAELDQAPAHGVRAPALERHVMLVVAEARRRESGQPILPRPTGAAIEQIEEKLSEVTAVGGDGLSGQTLLELAVTQELAV